MAPRGGWLWLALPVAVLAALWGYALQLRPPFPTSSLSLDPDLLALLAAHPRPTLSAAERKQFNATGVLIVRDAIPAPVIARLQELLTAEPPVASPLFSGALSYVTSHAWTHYEGLRQLTASSLSAGLAAQLLGGTAASESSSESSAETSVRLVNTVAYGIGRGQGGADWHTDELSYRPVQRSVAGERDDSGVSVWIPLQKLQGGTAGEGGGLAVVPLNTASTHCYDAGNHDSLTGRLRTDAGGGGKAAERAASRAECERTLAQRGVSVGPMEPGDLLLFGRSVWHRTEPPTESFPSAIRWSYTERYVADGSFYSAAAEEHWAHEYLTQPLCEAGLKDGDVLSGDCFPAMPLAAGGTETETGLPRPRYTMTGAVGRAIGIAQHWFQQTMRRSTQQPIQNMPKHTRGMVRAWGVAFAWTQLLECPVYLFLQPRLMRVPAATGTSAAAAAATAAASSAGFWFDLGVGFGASLISHPPATAFYWEVSSWAAPPVRHNVSAWQAVEEIVSGEASGAGALWLKLYAWEVVEVCVFVVETLWLLWAHCGDDGGRWMRQRHGWYGCLLRAAMCSLLANGASIAGGLVLNAWAPHLLR